MSAGKYSPTVSTSYTKDQEWWARNGGGYGNGVNPNSDNDDDGYDSYGYSSDGTGPDRAGHLEDDYLLSGEHIGDDFCYPLLEQVYSEWATVVIVKDVK